MLPHFLTRRAKDGTPGDPHLHLHITFPALLQGTDRQWGAWGPGGHELFRYIAALGEFAKARLRQRLAARLGMRFGSRPAWRWSRTDARHHACGALRMRGAWASSIAGTLSGASLVDGAGTITAISATAFANGTRHLTRALVHGLVALRAETCDGYLGCEGTTELCDGDDRSGT